MALLAESPLQRLVSRGLGALAAADRRLITDTQRACVVDSLDLDTAARVAQPQSNRWDYLLSVTPSGDVVGLEPHPAKDAEVRVVIAKRQAAIDFLRNHLEPGRCVARWIWVTRGKVGFSRMDAARRRLDQAGIEFAGRTVRSLS